MSFDEKKGTSCRQNGVSKRIKGAFSRQQESSLKFSPGLQTWTVIFMSSPQFLMVGIKTS